MGFFSGGLISIVNLGSRISLVSIPLFYFLNLFKKYPKLTAFIILTPLSLLVFMVILSLEYSPYTNRYRLMFLDEKAEMIRNKQEFKSSSHNLSLNYELVTEELLALIRIIIFQLLECSGEKSKRDVIRQSWQILIIDDDSFQAKVVSSGQILINTGTLRAIQSVDELAFILAHEIGHILYRHDAEMNSYLDLTNNFLFVLSGIIDVMVSIYPKLCNLLGPTLTYCSKGSFLYPYNRIQELEADKAGAFLMARAGFNPSHAVKLWQRLDSNLSDNVDHQEINQIHVYTHPNMVDRIKQLDKLIPKVSAIYSKVIDDKKNGKETSFKLWKPLYEEPGWLDKI